MSDQNRTQATTKRYSSRSASKRNDMQVVVLQRPAKEDKKAWVAYWKAQGYPWRTKPEIDDERQKYLEEQRKIMPDINRGIYSFKGIKLGRDDIEWLLATHNNGQGPIDWNDESQRWHYGLDLRGVDLRDEDLSHLPLTCMRGGTPLGDATDEQREAMIIHLEGANLAEAHLEGAQLSEAHMEKTYLRKAHLEDAQLYATHLERATLEEAHLESARLDEAHLENAYTSKMHLEGADLRNADLKGANLDNAHLEGADLAEAHLEGTNFSGSFFGSLTNLSDIFLSAKEYGCISLADIHWGDANVAVVDWSSLTVLGDEQDAKKRNQKRKPVKKSVYLPKYQRGLRAYRQLAVVLRNQGLTEDANRFAFRA